MKSPLIAVEPRQQSCGACAVRPFSVCASIDKTEMDEFEHISRHVHFTACETVFAQEDVTTSFYNVLDGVLRLYKLLPDCLLYTSPSPRDGLLSRMPSSA